LDLLNELIMADPLSAAAGAGKIAELGLAQQASNLSSLILNASRDVITLIDRKGIILFQSAAIEQHVGRPVSDLIGREFCCLVDEQDCDAVSEMISSIVNEKLSGGELQFRSPNRYGAPRWFEANFSNRIDDDQLNGIVIVARDVSCSTSVNVLPGASERTPSLMQYRWPIGANAPVWVGGSWGDRSDLKKKDGLDLTWIRKNLLRDDAILLDRLIAEAKRSNRPFSCRLRTKDLNGRCVHILNHAFVETDDKNRPVAIIGICFDISDQVAAEDALRESEDQYRLITEEAYDMIVRSDLLGRCLYVSPAVTRLLGYSPDEYRELNPIEMLMPEDALASRVFIEHLTEHPEEHITTTGRVRHRDGHYVWVESVVKMALDHNTGRYTGFVSVSRDVDDRKRVEEELVAARERAELASQTKSRFLANMSHELRTPLNAIIGFSDLIHRQIFGEIGSPRYLEYAQLINESGALLLDLISDILDMSKIEAGKLELHIEDINIPEIVDSCLQLMTPGANEAQLNLVGIVDPTLISMRADRRALKQILLNLLSNAVKFTPPGGAVRVDVGRIEDMVEFEISDTGIGIQEADIARITQPFEQAAPSPELAQGGSGLGLSLVHALVEMHGGEFTIASQADKGTTVKVRIPPLAEVSEAREFSSTA
jgi:PAS domain S-box-containing protein